MLSLIPYVGNVADFTEEIICVCVCFNVDWGVFDNVDKCFCLNIESILTHTLTYIKTLRLLCVCLVLWVSECMCVCVCVNVGKCVCAPCVFMSISLLLQITHLSTLVLQWRGR